MNSRYYRPRRLREDDEGRCAVPPSSLRSSVVPGTVEREPSQTPRSVSMCRTSSYVILMMTLKCLFTQITLSRHKLGLATLSDHGAASIDMGDEGQNL